MAYGEWAEIYKAAWQADQESRQQAERTYQAREERRRYADELTRSDRVSDRSWGYSIQERMAAEEGHPWEDSGGQG